MGESKQIGIIFKNNPDWTGGVYYILNLIRALKTLPESEQPVIHLFCWSPEDFKKVADETNYPLLVYEHIPFKIKYNFFQRVINSIYRKITGRNFFEKRFNKKIDFIFPYTYDYYFDLIHAKIFWLPDFQDRYLPQFFTSTEIAARLAHQTYLATGQKKIVFSSYDARNDYTKFFPDNDSQTSVLRFASTGALFPTQEHKTNATVKFNLPQAFFYVPNQFWAHKNHKVVISAVEELAKQGKAVRVYFSGNENDYRNPGFIHELKELVVTKRLDQHIKFLGFIERQEVFTLMKMARAVIQPSLFEGWSTVIEDAKSVNAFVVASSIAVHKEQLDKNAIFFDPHNTSDLADIITQLTLQQPDVVNFDYTENIQAYAKQIVQLEHVLNKKPVDKQLP